MGGFFGESKTAILKEIPQDYLPKTLFFDSRVTLSDIVAEMKSRGLNFPVVCKPDKGERGYKVEKINDLGDLSHYLETSFDGLIVQEFVDFPIELGVLYCRFPNSKKGRISSVVRKQFLNVVGNGKSTIRELLQQSLRARFQIPELERRWQSKLNQILPLGETWLAEPIGNHSRGTCFLNANHLINAELESVFDRISLEIDGFCYGRFDLKVSSLEELYKGNTIRVMELNGVISEPAHIYDPSMTLLKAWNSIFAHMKTLYQIAKANHKLGVAYVPLSLVIGTGFKHFASLHKEVND